MAIGQKLYLQARYGVFSVQAGQTGYFIYTVTSVATVADNDTAPLASSSDYRLTMITDAGGRMTTNKVVVVTAVSGSAAGSKPVHRRPRRHDAHAAGRTRQGPPVRSIEPAKGAVWWNATVASFLLRAIAAATVIVLLVRHHRPAVAAAVSVPLLLAVLLPSFWSSTWWPSGPSPEGAARRAARRLRPGPRACPAGERPAKPREHPATVPCRR